MAEAASRPGHADSGPWMACGGSFRHGCLTGPGSMPRPGRRSLRSPQEKNGLPGDHDSRVGRAILFRRGARQAHPAADNGLKCPLLPSEEPAMAPNPYDLYDVRSLLSEEERAVQDTVARFTDERVLPIIGDCFDQGRFPTELIPEIAGLGLLGATLPEEYGGAGLNSVSYGLICQELERGDSGLRSFASVQSSLCMYPIYAYGTEEQKRRWLPDMAAGKVIGCF